MIIIQVTCGLGNQMFQYALYRKFKTLGKKVKLDISWYDINDVHNGYELEKVFEIKAEYASEEEVFSTIKQSVYFEEKFFVYQKEILEINEGYVIGYWQNVKYFSDIREVLLNDFKFRIQDESNLRLLNRIKNKESVSIHIRRGDYLSLPEFSGIGTLKYFSDAIDIITNKIGDVYLFIFTNDIGWAKENFKIENCEIVDINQEKANSYKDMFLMSECKHNIICNSTFSWWGAWLNENETRIIVKPEIWTVGRYGNTFNLESDSKWIECKLDIPTDKSNNILKYIQNIELKFDHEYDILLNLFTSRRYDMIKRLRYEHTKEINNKKYISYFNLRININEQDFYSIESNMCNFVELIDVNERHDFDLYVSALFHLGVLNFKTEKYEDARILFNKIDDIMFGTHLRVREYLKEIDMKK